MKKIYTIILVATLGFFFAGCDHYLDVNKNIDAPDEDQVQDYHYLAGIESALQGLTWDCRATLVLSQMMATSSYTGFCTHYWTPSDAGGEMWRVTYWLQGKNLENFLAYALEHEHWTYVGIGYALKAHSWDVTSKENGDMPLRQAFEPGRLSHDYDYQDLIYDSVQAWALRAIDYLQMPDATVYGKDAKNADIIYKMDKDKWIKFAHGILCRNMISLVRKTDFLTKYADQVIEHGKLAMQTIDDDCMIEVPGDGSDAQFPAMNHFWAPVRGNIGNNYWQGDYIVKIMTGTVPLYDHATGDIIKTDRDDIDTDYYPYALNPVQIICDTIKTVPGHYDPRVAAKLSTRHNRTYENIDDENTVKNYYYYGGQFTSQTGYQGWNAGNLWGINGEGANVAHNGVGRWMFSDDTPYVIMTSAEINFCMAEAYFLKGDKANALACWKKAVELDVQFTGKYLKPGKPLQDAKGNYVNDGANPGGDKITVELYNKLAQEYLAGPYVAGITASTLTLSHIMMQKYVHEYPWLAYEAWVDQRKYQYDIDYTGDYPKLGNGWSKERVNQKWDEDETKVYKGFYLQAANVEDRKSAYDSHNNGSPAYRLTPRYNSEYMWNAPALKALKPIPGMLENGDYENYHTSMPWFCYPGDYPESL
jgi:hypothetical protein